MANAEWRQRVENGVDDRRRSSQAAGFTDALRAERVVGRGNLRQLNIEGGNIIGPSQCVIHQRTGSELCALGVVDRMFAQGLTDTRGDAAVNLALNDNRIDRTANILNQREAFKCYRTSFRVYFDFAYLATTR